MGLTPPAIWQPSGSPSQLVRRHTTASPVSRRSAIWPTLHAKWQRAPIMSSPTTKDEKARRVSGEPFLQDSVPLNEAIIQRRATKPRQFFRTERSGLQSERSLHEEPKLLTS